MDREKKCNEKWINETEERERERLGNSRGKGNEIGQKLGFRRREEKTGAAKRRDDG